MIEIHQPGSGTVRDVFLFYKVANPPPVGIPSAVVATDNQPPNQGMYTATDMGGISSVRSALQQIAAQTGSFQLGRLFLVGFSEGGQAVEAHLKDGVDPFAVVVADGIQTPRPLDPADIQPWIDFAEKAKAGQRVFVASTSLFTDTKAVSVLETLRAITGFPLDSSGPMPACVRTQTGTAIVYICDGAHDNHRDVMLSRMVADAASVPAPGRAGNPLIWFLAGSIGLGLLYTWVRRE